MCAEARQAEEMFQRAVRLHQSGDKAGALKLFIAAANAAQQQGRRAGRLGLRIRRRHRAESGGGRALDAYYFDQRNKRKITRRLLERLERLGYQVTLQEVEAVAPAVVADDAPAVSAVAAPKRRRGRPCKCAERGIACTHEPPEKPDKSTETTIKAEPATELSC